MERNWYYRLVVYLFITLVSIFTLIPTVKRWTGWRFELPGWYSRFVTASIRPGLDVQGGVNLVYGIDYDQAFTNQADSIAGTMEAECRRAIEEFYKEKLAGGKKYEGLTVERLEEGAWAKIRINVPKEDKSAFQQIEQVYKKNYSQVLLIEKKDPSKGELLLSFSDAFIQTIKIQTSENSISKLEKRLNARSVEGIEVQKRGDDINVSMPGNTGDYAEVRELIEKVSQLTFMIVEEEGPDSYMPKAAAYLEKNKARYPDLEVESSGKDIYIKSTESKNLDAFIKDIKNLKGEKSLPKGQTLLIGKETKRISEEKEEELVLSNTKTENEKEDSLQDEYFRTYLVRSKVELTGQDLTKAEAGTRGAKFIVNVSLRREGALVFERLTEQNINKRMAAVLDGMVVSAPSITGKISSNDFEISLGSSSDVKKMEKEAKNIAAALQVGALPASMTLKSTEQIAATLGSDVIHRAKMAMWIGSILVILFMSLYYRKSGLIAVLSMAFNIVYLLAIMATVKTSLTLPGIAAVVLSVGMAVDANIIIYERIREELRLGRSPKASVEGGFAHAFWTVFDAHIVGLVAGIVLYSYGTGPIQGFAVSFMAGIVCNLFTSVWLSRLMFDWMVRDRKKTTLSI